MLKRPKHIAALFLLLLSSLSAFAEDSREVPALNGATKIDDPNIDALVVALLKTYLLLREGAVSGRLTDSGVAGINFYYASGPNFIVDQKLSPNALTAFDTDAVDELSGLPTNTDICYVQSFVLVPSSQRLVLAVHHEDYDDPEDVFRCLIAGLWKFQERDLDQLDALDWRSSFYMITGAGLD